MTCALLSFRRHVSGVMRRWVRHVGPMIEAEEHS